MHTRTNVALCALVVVAATITYAEEPKRLVGTRKDTAPKVDLGLPAFKELPKDVKLEKAKAAEGQQGPRADEGYTILRVAHGRGGADAGVETLQLGSNPLTTPKFTSSVRVKAPSRRNARIDVAVLDPRGDAVMEASGELVFNPKDKTDETEWIVEWSPTTVRAAGEFSVSVRIGGNPMGAFPIKFAETPK